MQALKQTKDSILNAKSIVIACHLNPDGDSIGSLLSLGLGLKKLNKDVYLISRDGVPKKFKELPGADTILRTIDKNADLAIAVDCTTKDMLGSAYELFKKAKYILEIDHHEERVPFGHVSLIDTEAVAVGEIIYKLLNELKIDVTKDMAKNILTSIIVETNSFRISNITSEVFRICAEMIKTGIDFYELASKVFWSKDKTATILSGLCLSRCKFLKNDRLVWSIVQSRDFNIYKGKSEDIETVISDMLSIQKIETAVFFIEKNINILRVSLRSKGNVNIASIAKKYGGGGHYNAAGCFIPNNKKSIDQFLDEVAALIESPQLVASR